MNKPVLIIGAGGHASVLVDVLLQLNCSIVGVVSVKKPRDKSFFSKFNWYSKDEDVLQFGNNKVLLVNGIGSIPGNNARLKINQKFTNYGYEFMTVVSPYAIVSKYTTLHDGVQIMSGAVVNANTKIGDGTIINTGAIIDHDCVIGKHNHIATGAKLSGSVRTSNYVHIGTGASIGHCVDIGENSVVGAGVSIVNSIKDNVVITPAKNKKQIL